MKKNMILLIMMVLIVACEKDKTKVESHRKPQTAVEKSTSSLSFLELTGEALLIANTESAGQKVTFLPDARVEGYYFQSSDVVHIVSITFETYIPTPRSGGVNVFSQTVFGDLPGLSAELYCENLTCYQLYIVVKEKGHPLGAFVFHKNSSQQSTSEWILKTSMTSGLADISSGEDLAFYIKQMPAKSPGVEDGETDSSLPFDEIVGSYRNDGHGYVARVRKGKKWGLVSWDNEWFIPAEYDAICYPFSDLICVRKGNKWGYIDTSNEIVIPIQYDSVSLPDYKTQSLIAMREGRQWSLFNVIFKRWVSPMIGEFDHVTPLAKGFVLVRKGNKYGLFYINAASGGAPPVQILEVEYDSIRTSDNGLASFKKNGQFGLINENGH